MGFQDVPGPVQALRTVYLILASSSQLCQGERRKWGRIKFIVVQWSLSVQPGHGPGMLSPNNGGYIKMNPVAANLVRCPGDYHWSSAQVHLAGEDATLTHVAPLLGPQLAGISAPVLS